MANAQAMCTSFKKDLLNGLHAFGTSVVRAATTPDTFKAALYLASASPSIGAATTAYTATGEVSDASYTAGGVAVGSWNAPATSGTVAFTQPAASIVYNALTSAAAFDCVLIYNNTATGKNAVSAHTFGAQTITAGTLTLTMPTSDQNNALLRLA